MDMFRLGEEQRITRSRYDARGRVRQVVAPDGATKSETFYNELDQVVASQQIFNGAIQSCWVTFRDARDRVIHSRTQNTDYRATTLDQHSDTYTFYSKTGAVKKQVDPLGSPTAPGHDHKTTYMRDARDRVESVIDGKGVIVAQYLYGEDDLVKEMRVPDPSSKSPVLLTAFTRSYTGRKEVLSEKDQLGNGTTYSYGNLPGQLSTATDAAGIVNRTVYDTSTQRVKEIIEAEGSAAENRTKHVWANGLLTQTKVWNPQSNAYDATFTRTYDQAGRLERIESPAITQGTPIAPERFLYNGFGELKTQIAGMKTVDHARDLLGRTTQSNWYGAYSAQINKTYNGAGQVETVSDGALSKTMFYETWKGTPHTESVAVNGQPWKMQTHGFDNAGNYTAFGDGEGGQHQWPVDENNRPVEIRYQDKTSRTISYTPGGLVDQETLRNASGVAIATTTHKYDSLGRKVNTETVQAGTGEVQRRYDLEYDIRHRINAIHHRHLGASVTLGLDDRGRPTTESTAGNNGGQNAPAFETQFGDAPTGNNSADSEECSARARQVLAVPARSATYTYSAGGNRTSAVIDGVETQYTYNAANQLISETSATQIVTHEYDELANEIKRTTLANTQGAVPLVERYGYNHLNLLSTYTNSGTNANWQYDHYPTGERYGKTDLNTNTSELYVSRFGDVATEYSKLGSAAPQTKNTYVQGLGVDSKNIRISASGTRRHYLSDQVGTLADTLDDAAEIIETRVSDAWGVPLAGSSSERYSGIAQREVDTESGLTFMRHRMYDPKLGRFTQTDPIVGRRATAHYTYASNNPISRIDPRGLQDDTTYYKATIQWSQDRLEDYTKEQNDPSYRKRHWPTVSDTERDILDDIADLRRQRRQEGDDWRGTLELQERRRLGALESSLKGNEEAFEPYRRNMGVDIVLAYQAPLLMFGSSRRIGESPEIRPGERAKAGAGVKLTSESETATASSTRKPYSPPTVTSIQVPYEKPPQPGPAITSPVMPGSGRPHFEKPTSLLQNEIQEYKRQIAEYEDLMFVRHRNQPDMQERDRMFWKDLKEKVTSLEEELGRRPH